MDRREWAVRVCAAFAGLGVTVRQATASVQRFNEAVAPLELGDDVQESPARLLGQGVRIVGLPEEPAVGVLTAIEYRKRGGVLEVRGRVALRGSVHLWVSLDKVRRAPPPPVLQT